jgi:CubicO group peptidase (beta-lactamase class C family)
MGLSKVGIACAVSLLALTSAPGTDAQVPGEHTTGRVTTRNWDTPATRAYALRNFDKIVRYGMTVRASKVRTLTNADIPAIASLPEVRFLEVYRGFSALVVVRDGKIVHERYGYGFGPSHRHSAQSTTKTMINLIIGKLVEDGKIDLSAKVKTYIPEIGSGYAEASVQDILDMNVANDFEENYDDPDSLAALHEHVSGWRPPKRDVPDSVRRFLVTIKSKDIETNGRYEYKAANTDVLGWVAERAAKRPLQEIVRDLMAAVGGENAMFISTDQEGFPALMGGMVVTARDWARYGMLFLNGGVGVNGRQVGSAKFIEETLEHEGAKAGENVFYSNHFFTDGDVLVHEGWGGQYLAIDPSTKTVIVFFSGLSNATGDDPDYSAAMKKMARAVFEFLRKRSKDKK